MKINYGWNSLYRQHMMMVVRWHALQSDKPLVAQPPMDSTIDDMERCYAVHCTLRTLGHLDNKLYSYLMLNRPLRTAKLLSTTLTLIAEKKKEQRKTIKKISVLSHTSNHK